ncbi:MAG: arsenite methyltransferase [Promethearchaeota archaeon]
MRSEEKIKEIVRKQYSKVALSNNQNEFSGCGCSSDKNVLISKVIGYKDDDFNAVPEGSNLGLGCGNPIALASLKEGETVIDLGSGAGFDAFLASKKVGKTGKVIGVDMTPAMISKARENAKQGDFENVEFRLGEIEHLPVSDAIADIIISNCVINLVPNKREVFKDAFRVLKPGGRLMISDIVVTKKLPEFIQESIEAYTGCISGAILKEDYIKLMEESGFQEVKILGEVSYPIDLFIYSKEINEIIEKNNISLKELKEIARTIVSVKISAYKH